MEREEQNTIINMKSIIILSFVLVCSVLAASSDKDTESKVARYLKSCGVITSLKTTKCVKVGEKLCKSFINFVNSEE